MGLGHMFRSGWEITWPKLKNLLGVHENKVFRYVAKTFFRPSGSRTQLASKFGTSLSCHSCHFSICCSRYHSLFNKSKLSWNTVLIWIVRLSHYSNIFFATTRRKRLISPRPGFRGRGALGHNLVGGPYSKFILHFLAGKWQSVLMLTITAHRKQKFRRFVVPQAKF